jgi:hypothetical protein
VICLGVGQPAPLSWERRRRNSTATLGGESVLRDKRIHAHGRLSPVKCYAMMEKTLENTETGGRPTGPGRAERSKTQTPQGGLLALGPFADAAFVAEMLLALARASFTFGATAFRFGLERSGQRGQHRQFDPPWTCWELSLPPLNVERLSSSTRGV